MGLALKRNDTSSVFVDDVWSDIPVGATREQWDMVTDEAINMNLSYEEFQRVDAGRSGHSSRGPWINAVPYLPGGLPRAVAVLDMDPEDARALHLDSESAVPDVRAIAELLAECARIAEGDENTWEVDR